MKTVLVVEILNQLKGLVQSPCVNQELHNDAERVVGGSNACRSHLVEKVADPCPRCVSSDNRFDWSEAFETRKARLMDPRNSTPLPTWRNDDKLNGRLPHFFHKRRRAMHGIAIGTGVIRLHLERKETKIPMNDERK